MLGSRPTYGEEYIIEIYQHPRRYIKSINAAYILVHCIEMFYEDFKQTKYIIFSLSSLTLRTRSRLRVVAEIGQ